jgi:hypothetical protein
MTVTKLDLFEDVAVAMESWTDAASDALTGPEADLNWAEEQEPYRRIQRALAQSDVHPDDVRTVLAECLRGFAVSMLTALDGGTALSEKGRIYLVDKDGGKLGEGLHDDFVGYLLDTGRLK